MAYIISSGELESGIILTSNSMTVLDGGTATDTTVNSGGRLFVSNGGTADTTTVNAVGSMNVKGGTANHTTINSGGKCFVSGSGTADDIEVNCGGVLSVGKDGAATNIMENGGNVDVADGANVTFQANTFVATLNDRSTATVHSGTTAANTTVNSGLLTVYSGGRASDTIVNSGGTFSISGGGTAENTRIASNGRMSISSGGVADVVNITSNGTVNVLKGGVASNVYVRVNGGIRIASGGKLTGKVIDLEGAIYASSGAIVDFDLTRKLPGAAALFIIDGSTIQGTATYTITVNSDQAEGIYSLFEYIYNNYTGGFSSQITVQDTEGTALGVLSVGETITISDTSYTLDLSDSRLFLKIGETITPSPYTSDGIVVYRGQKATVSSGEIYHDTEVWGGELYVLSGGTADIVSISPFSRGNVFISSGGTANSVMVNSFCSMFVSGGGTVNGVELKSGGELYVSTGGTATEIRENGGFVVVANGANVTFVPNTIKGLLLQNASATIHSGTTANSAAVNTSAHLLISSGGTANGTTITSGWVYVSKGGKANSTTILKGTREVGGAMFVSSGGVADDTTILSGGWMDVSSGAVANNTTVNASLFVYSRGTANGVTVSSNGFLHVGFSSGNWFQSGGTVNSAVVVSGGSMNVAYGGVANSTTVSSGGRLSVAFNGTVTSTTVNFRGSLSVQSGGTANAIVENGGCVDVANGAKAVFASNTISGLVLSSASATVHSGTTAAGVQIENGDLCIYSGGLAENIAANKGGTIRILDGGIANGITNSGGKILVSSGGTVIDAITRNNWIHLYEYGTASNATISVGGSMDVATGAIAADTTVYSGGCLLINRGGKVTGKMVFDGGAAITMNGGAIVDFDLTQTEAGAEEALVNDLSVIQGAPLYTLTVDGVLAGGVYMLAEGAEDFESTITVVDKSSGDELGVLTVGETASFGHNDFTLNLEAGVLSLSVTVSPEIVSGAILKDESRTVNFWERYEDTTLNYSGSLTILSGGAADNTIVNSSGTLHVSSGGTAAATTVNPSGKLYVTSGGTANDTKISAGGNLYVSSGGTANSTTVNYGGRLFVSSGATAAAIVENGGYVSMSNDDDVAFASNSFDGLLFFRTSATVHSGTTANSTTVYSAVMSVCSGGTANSTTINPDGRLYVSSGGTAFDTTIGYGGGMFVSNGGTVTGIQANSGGSMTVASGGTALNIVENGGYVSIADGAEVSFASNTISGLYIREFTIFRITIHSGTTAMDAVVPRNGFTVYSGGKLTGRIITAKTGTFTVSSGGIIEFDLTRTLPGAAPRMMRSQTISGSPTYTIKVGADQAEGIYALRDSVTSFEQTITVSNSEGAELGTIALGETITVTGVEYELYLTDDNVLTLRIGDTVTPSPYTSNGILLDSSSQSVTVQSGEVYHDTFLESSGTLIISSGGTADATALGMYGRLQVSSGGTALRTDLLMSGSVSVFSGGVASETLVNIGSFSVLSGGTADRVTVNGGTLTVSSGGTALNILENGGFVSIADGAEVTFVSNTISGLVFEREQMTVHSGTEANSMTLLEEARIFVRSGGVVNDALLLGNAARIEVYSGGVVNNAHISSSLNCSGGGIYIHSGGVVNNTTMDSPYWGIFLESGGIVNGITVNAGPFHVFGGKLTGRLVFESRADISIYNNPILDFDLTQTEVGAGALVNNLSPLKGNCLYTLTVDADSWEVGSYSYSLAEGAKNFAGTITVVDKSSGDELGVLTVGETVRIGGNDYTLSLNEETLSVAVDVIDWTVTGLVGTADKLSWTPNGAPMYYVELSTDNFEHAVVVLTTAPGLDLMDLPSGSYQWCVVTPDGTRSLGEEIESENEPGAAKVVQSNNDGIGDLFFATPNGTWDNTYYAQNVGSINDWEGTKEIVSAKGRNRIQNLYFGAASGSILCLTDDANGDAIFVDDVYTGLPDEIEDNMARLYMIEEIRAGAGDDIVDMTSQRFEYTGDRLFIHGGDGNDVLWANKGAIWLFGDEGNDRIVGSSDADLIVGGSGNDQMHGGGGDDVFTFCENWGNDTVQQLETGLVTLWFASGDETHWDASTMTYTYGDNSVKITGVTAEQVTLQFGDNGSADYALFANFGAFNDFTTRTIFDDLATLANS